METCEALFCKMALKSMKKALGLSVKVDGVLRLRKCQKSIGPREFWSIQGSSLKYIIKPVVYGDL